MVGLHMRSLSPETLSDHTSFQFHTLYASLLVTNSVVWDIDARADSTKKEIRTREKDKIHINLSPDVRKKGGMAEPLWYNVAAPFAAS